MKNITISKNYFEHLLLCLANQKYITCINADATTCDYKRIQTEHQNIIDKAYHDGMVLLHPIN